MAGIDDPLGVGAPILQTGAGALDVGFKRMAVEQQDRLAGAKLAQDKGIADAKLKAAKDKELMKAMPASTGTVFLPYKLDYQAKRDELDKQRGADLLAYDKGELTDLQVAARHDARVAGLAQYEDYTKQIGKMYETNSKYMLEHPEEFKPGALKEYQTVVSDVSLANNGVLPENPTHLWDLNKNIMTTFGAMKADTNAWAAADGTSSGSDTYIIPEHFKGLADQFAAGQWAGPSLVEHFAGLSPDRQEFINKLAETNKISKGAATAMDYAMNLYDAKTEVRKTEQVNEGSAGVKADEAAALWLAQVFKGEVEGTLSMEEKRKLKSPGKGGAEGEVDVTSSDPIFKGWAWSSKTVYDPDGKQHIKTVSDIKDYTVSPDGKTITIKTGPVDGDVNNVETIPADQWESRVVGRLYENNEKKLRGQGIFDAAAEKIGLGDREKTSGKNIVKTKPKGGALNLTAGEFD